MIRIIKTKRLKALESENKELKNQLRAIREPKTKTKGDLLLKLEAYIKAVNHLRNKLKNLEKYQNNVKVITGKRPKIKTR